MLAGPTAFDAGAESSDGLNTANGAYLGQVMAMSRSRDEDQQL